MKDLTSHSGHGCLLTITPVGIYCPEGDFHIDPWGPVPRAVITHAHSDHSRPGSQTYLCTETGRGVLSERVQANAVIESMPYGQPLRIGNATVRFHPAGHILGSAQVSVEVRGQRWVVSGDYKTSPDPTCTPFEPVPCHTFITESTFGLPVFHWKPESIVISEILAWWRENRSKDITSVLLTYALGKAQRILAGLLEEAPGPIAVHGTIQRFLPHYAQAGIRLPDCSPAARSEVARIRGKGLVLAPPSVQGTAFLGKFQPHSVAMASGWMTIKGIRRRRALDRGFELSDHADWNGLIEAIRLTGARNVGVTHGYVAPLCRTLQELIGVETFAVPTRFRGEMAEPDEPEPPEEASQHLTPPKPLASVERLYGSSEEEP
jgi:putative mRNA 3-end processing factor